MSAFITFGILLALNLPLKIGPAGTPLTPACRDNTYAQKKEKVRSRKHV